LEPAQQAVVLEEVMPYTQLNLSHIVLRILDKLNAHPYGMTGTGPRQATEGFCCCQGKPSVSVNLDAVTAIMREAYPKKKCQIR
jgi:hypothetical protein